MRVGCMPLILLINFLLWLLIHNVTEISLRTCIFFLFGFVFSIHYMAKKEKTMRTAQYCTVMKLRKKLRTI